MRLSKKLTALLLATVILGCTTLTAFGADQTQENTLEQQPEVVELLKNEKESVPDNVELLEVIKSDKEFAEIVGATQETTQAITEDTTTYAVARPEKEVEETVGAGIVNKDANVILGDVNFDNMIDLSDVIIMQKYIANMVKLSEDSIAAGKVAGSKDVTMVDVLMVQKYISLNKQIEKPIDNSGKEVIVGAYIDSIKLNKSTIAMVKGDAQKLTADISPSIASNEKVVWKSSNESVAVVDAKGNVRAINNGDCNITCASADNSSKKAVCAVKVVNKITDITIDEGQMHLSVSKTKSLSMALLPSTATKDDLVFKSSNSKIATVNSSGKITAVAAGRCVVMCSALSDSSIKAACVVTVVNPIKEISFDTTSVSWTVGQSEKFKTSVVPYNTSLNNLVFKTSNDKVATIDSLGKVTAVGVGDCTITCESIVDSTVKASCKVTVINKITNITLNTHSVNWMVGTTGTYKPTIVPAEATVKNLVFKSSDEKIATVSETGRLTAVAPGVCTVTCEAADGSGVKDVCEVTVVKPITNIKLNTNSLTWSVGTKGTYKPAITPSNVALNNVVFKSSNEKVAAVSRNGKLTAVAPGTCIITCEAADGNGVKDTCTVTVVRPVTSIKLNKTSAKIKEGNTVTLTATASPSNATNKDVTWKSSNTAVAKVSSTGVVTGVKKGTVTITATAKDGYKAVASCKITVEESKTKGEQIADYAAQWVGVTPYVWGGTSLTGGADCSGFVCSIYDKFGYNLWENRTTLSNVGKSVSYSDAKPGDILVFSGHVGIYAGNGKVTHAVNSYYGTMTTDLSWGGTLLGVRRVV